MKKITLKLTEEHYLSLVQVIDMGLNLVMNQSMKIPYPPNKKIAKKYGKFLNEHVLEWDRLKTIRAQVVRDK